jgi:lipopolysaccharide transport system permease protein
MTTYSPRIREMQAETRINVLRPPGRFSPLRVGELWHFRELLYILAWRDVKVRYKQAVLGAAWALVQPIAMMAIFTLLFSKVANVPTGGVPYPVFAFVGLVPWTLFSNGVSSSGNSLVGSQNLVTRVYFPRLVIPSAAVLAWLPDFVISAVFVFVIMAIFSFMPPGTALLLPVVMVAAIFAALSVGIWLSALNVAYRDVQYVVPFLIQVWLFLTPVAYPTTSVPEGFRWITGLNPMTWVIDLSRWSLTGTPFTSGIAAMSFGITVALFVSGLYYFRRVEHFFADVI